MRKKERGTCSGRKGWDSRDINVVSCPESLSWSSQSEIILKQLAFDNANEDCQAIIRPIRGQGGVMEY